MPKIRTINNVPRYPFEIRDFIGSVARIKNKTLGVSATVAATINLQNLALASIQAQEIKIVNSTPLQDEFPDSENPFHVKSLPNSIKYAYTPLYWLDFALSWLLTPLRAGLKYIGCTLTQPAAYFWNKASLAIQYNQKMAATKAIMGLIFLGAIPCYLAQIFHLTANVLFYAQRLFSGIAELISAPVCVFFSSIFSPLFDKEPLTMDDFDVWYAFTEICWNTLFLIPAALIVFMSIIPVFGQIAAPALVPLISTFNAALQGFILGALYAPIAQLITTGLQAIRIASPTKCDTRCTTAANQVPEDYDISGAVKGEPGTPSTCTEFCDDIYNVLAKQDYPPHDSAAIHETYTHPTHYGDNHSLMNHHEHHPHTAVEESKASPASMATDRFVPVGHGAHA